jgi:HEAT repeat protein
MTSGGPSGGSELRLAELGRALASADPRTRAAAAARAGSEPGAEGMLLLVLTDEEPLVRLAAVRALAGVSGPQATRSIIRMATTDPSPEVRAEAVAAVGRALKVALRRAGQA